MKQETRTFEGPLDTWELQYNTFCQDRRRKYADEAADKVNPFRTEGLVKLAPVDVSSQSLDGPTRTEGSLDYYDLDWLIAQPLLQQVALSPNVIIQVAMHLGAMPNIVDINMWRSRVNPGSPEIAQVFHRDMDDWRACKLFVYMTDVGPDNGPHQFMVGTHRADFFEKRGLPPDVFFLGAGRGVKVEPKFPYLEITGPAGTAWLGNTYAYHRGKPPVSGERVVYQVCYGYGGSERGQRVMEKWCGRR